MISISETAENLIPGNERARTILKALGITNVIPNVPVVRYEATEPAARAAVVAKIEALLLAGDPIPDDIAEPIRKAHEADQVGLARAEIIDATVRQAWAVGNDSVTAESIQPALDFLRTELERVMTERDKHAKHLAGITAAEQVIGADPKIADAWTELTRLGGVYDEIRQKQRDLYRRADPDIHNAEMHAAEFTDAIDIDPFWIQRRHNSSMAARPSMDVTRKFVKWLGSPVNRYPVYMNPDQPTALRMAALRNVWLPSIDELWEAYREAHQATAVPTDFNVADLAENLHTYYRITGAKPSINLTAELGATVPQKPPTTKGNGTNTSTRSAAARERIAERIGTPNNDPWHDRPSVPPGGWD